MKFQYRHTAAQGELHLIQDEMDFDRLYFKRDYNDKFLTIVWNRGPAQIITVDEMQYNFPAQSILPLMVSDSFRFEIPGQIVAWQFNRNFYCIVDHDKEIGCVGFLFFGFSGMMFISLDNEEQRKINQLLLVFMDEFQTSDNIQHDMLLILLKRLIIIITRLAKKQHIAPNNLNDDKLDIVRRYNLLVENNFRAQHSVRFYADQLNKSPKTLANVFALYNHNSPLAVIRQRLVMEAKRLLIYTNKSAKEIAYELGFEDTAYFSNFFKKQVSQSPLDFRNTKSTEIPNQ